MTLIMKSVGKYVTADKRVWWLSLGAALAGRSAIVTHRFRLMEATVLMRVRWFEGMGKARRLVVLAAGAALVAVGVWAIWFSGGPQLLPGQTRAYSSLSACLVTDAHGVASGEAAAVWSGMQAAASDTNANITNTPLSAASTSVDADVAVNSLVAEHCTVVLAVGDRQVAAVAARAAAFPAERFVIISARTVPAGNVQGVSTAKVDAISDGVRRSVENALTQAGA